MELLEEFSRTQYRAKDGGGTSGSKVSWGGGSAVRARLDVQWGLHGAEGRAACVCRGVGGAGGGPAGQGCQNGPSSFVQLRGLRGVAGGRDRRGPSSHTLVRPCLCVPPKSRRTRGLPESRAQFLRRLPCSFLIWPAAHGSPSRGVGCLSRGVALAASRIGVPGGTCVGAHCAGPHGFQRTTRAPVKSEVAQSLAVLSAGLVDGGTCCETRGSLFEACGFLFPSQVVFPGAALAAWVGHALAVSRATESPGWQLVWPGQGHDGTQNPVSFYADKN